MKNPFKNTEGPGDPIENRHTQQLLPLARRLGKANGEMNVPKNGENLAGYIQQIKAGYQNLIAQEVSGLAIKTADTVTKFQETTVKDKLGRLHASLTDLNEKLRKALLTRDELPPGIEQGKQIGLHILIICIAMFESFFTAKAFALFSHGSNLAQIFVLIGLTVVYAMLPFALVHVIRSTENSPYKWGVRIAVFAIVLSGFVVLGILRGIYLQNIDTTTLATVKANSSVVLKPWYFAVLNIFFLLISTYGALQIKDKTQKENANTKQQLDKKIEDLETQIRQTEDQINRLPDTVTSTENTRQNNLALAHEKAGRIKNLYYECVGEYIQANLTWRSDGVQPASFSKVPDLEIPKF